MHIDDVVVGGIAAVTSPAPLPYPVAIHHSPASQLVT